MLIVLIVLILAALVLLTAYICFRMAFYVPDKEKIVPDFSMPEGEIYVPYHGQMLEWMHETRALPSEDVTVTAFDGLTLHGRFYEYGPDAPIELMLHGYRGSAERDLCGGVQRCFSLGRSVLLVDLRASGRSGGNVISFGINERHDCLAWVKYLAERFPSRKLILTGISMGAATVMMASAMDLPESVVCVLADCGYTSAREIIMKVIRQMHLPAKPLYPFVKLGAKLYGRFDLEETSPIEAMAACKVPIIFIHGEADDFVPCEMSLRCYEACTAPKTLLTVPGAGHGLCYSVAPELYLQALREFFAPHI